MTDKHSRSFFGQSTGITVKSSSKSDPFIFFTCIQKKQDGSWEKPSRGEGKTIKCSLDEMVMILRVLEGKDDKWSGYHSYKDNNTQIQFNWEDAKRMKLYINIGKYRKMLGIAEIEVFRRLLNHMVDEKIEFATGQTGPIINKPRNNFSKSNQKSETKKPKPELIIKEEIIGPQPKKEDIQDLFKENVINNADSSNKETRKIRGSIKAETEKALLIVFTSGKEVWIPKTTMHSRYTTEQNIEQTFIIDDWVLEKNMVL